MLFVACCLKNLNSHTPPVIVHYTSSIVTLFNSPGLYINSDCVSEQPQTNRSGSFNFEYYYYMNNIFCNKLGST